MCEIAIIKYVHVDGRSQTVERKRLCPRSDGQNPCLHHKRQEYTELVPPGTPGLSYDSTPVSYSMPGTPTTIAAPHYEIREPQGLHRSGSKGKGKAKPVHISFSSKRRGSPKSKSSRERRHDLDDDDDPIVAIEDHGVPQPRTPTNPSNRQIPSLGSPFATRPRRQPTIPPIINQPHPPPAHIEEVWPSSSQPSNHRRITTAPESISFHADNEFGRANARDDLRRQNREYLRQRDEAKQRQEERDRKLAEKLEKEEREQRAADEFSMRDYQRLQEKDKARKNREEEKERRAREQAEIDRLNQEIKERKLREKRRKEAEDALRLREESRIAEERIRKEDQLAEELMQEELAQHRRDQMTARAADLREIQAEIEKVENQLRQSRERTAARERAEKLQEDVRQHNLLLEEIALLEEDRRRDHIDDNEAEIRRLEADLARRNRAYERQPRDSRDYDRITGPRLGERRNIGAPPRTPVNVLQVRNPLEDVEVRRAYGEQVLERERNAAAQLSPGLSRRNTIAGGNDRDRAREQRYRQLRNWYPG